MNGPATPEFSTPEPGTISSATVVGPSVPSDLS